MNILVNNPALNTQIFLAVFVLLLIFSVRRKTSAEFLSPSVTQELKGLAILTVIFSHIGYNLVSDNRFLFPLSIAAGVGVNMFLFLSGYGLTMSALLKPLSPWQFYRRRLAKLYPPLWLSLALFIVLDFFITHKTYGLAVIGQAALGFFGRADVALDLNSPLWYFSLIVLYYLLFPLVFSRRFVWLSAGLLYLAGYFLIRWDPEFLGDVLRLYRVHILAFPLGMLFGGVVFKFNHEKLREKLATFNLMTLPAVVKTYGRYMVLSGLVWGVGYTSYYSRVGGIRWHEELTSIVTMVLAILFFSFKKLESRFLYLYGVYSFEIYLLHWPILSRFDIFYRFMPAWLATITYLGYFLLLGWMLRRAVDYFNGRLARTKDSMK